jgi:hypothetical protein
MRIGTRVPVAYSIPPRTAKSRGGVYKLESPGPSSGSACSSDWTSVGDQHRVRQEAANALQRPQEEPIRYKLPIIRLDRTSVAVMQVPTRPGLVVLSMSRCCSAPVANVEGQGRIAFTMVGYVH